VEALVAELAGCVAAYCWEDLPPADWAALLRRAREGVAAAAVALEDQVGRRAAFLWPWKRC
jgi:hypothetical protein